MSPRETGFIRKATQLESLALMDCMQSTGPGITEHELDAAAKYVYYYRNGAQGEAYYSLVQSGPDAMLGDYNAGKRQMKDGKLVLMDFAPDFGYYMSDISRTWPVNGIFIASQRQLHEFYTGCYRAILKAIKPGLTAQKILQTAVRDMDDILTKNALSKPIYNQAARAFVETFHQSSKNHTASLGHRVGMSMHDVVRDNGYLRGRMVFTVEPAFQVREEQIKIRCEDIIVITEKAPDVLLDFVLLSIDQIDKHVEEGSFLQNYSQAQAVEESGFLPSLHMPKTAKFLICIDCFIMRYVSFCFCPNWKTVLSFF
jgi:Xaa-Pro aminopeptidase